MVLSDETVQKVLDTLTKTLDEMRLVAKENSDLHKEIMGLLKEKTLPQGTSSKPKSEENTGE